MAFLKFGSLVFNCFELFSNFWFQKKNKIKLKYISVLPGTLIYMKIKNRIQKLHMKFDSKINLND